MRSVLRYFVLAPVWAAVWAFGVVGLVLFLTAVAFEWISGTIHDEIVMRLNP